MRRGASQLPIATAPTRKRTDFARIHSTAKSARLSPRFAAPIRPETTARTSSPSTSSITAAPRTIRPSVLSAFPRSPSTRAVMPTLVAQSVAPTNQSAREFCAGKKARVTK